MGHMAPLCIFLHHSAAIQFNICLFSSAGNREIVLVAVSTGNTEQLACQITLPFFLLTTALIHSYNSNYRFNHMIETKQKILDTAERLIGEQGYSGTSLRQIIAKAEVNLAAIHYHFGSKEELLDELVMRKAQAVNEERLARLDRLEANVGKAPLTVAKVLEAFFIPMAEAADRDPQFVRLMGRILTEGLLYQIVQKHFQTVTRRFFGALRKALPALSDDEFQWRAHFMIGAMAHTMCGQVDPTGKGGATGTFRDRIGHLIPFLDGGLHAPAGAAPHREAK